MKLSTIQKAARLNVAADEFADTCTGATKRIFQRINRAFSQLDDVQLATFFDAVAPNYRPPVASAKTEVADRLERIAAKHQTEAESHERDLTYNQGKGFEESSANSQAWADAHRRAAAIIRYQIECEA